MKQRFPVLECTNELWEKIKPILESFGIKDFNNIGDCINKPNFDKYKYLVTNFDLTNINKFEIGNISNFNIPLEEKCYCRKLVHTKEEFLDAVANILNKKYLICDKINIAKKLLRRKKGLKLYHTIYGEVTFDYVDKKTNCIYILANINGKTERKVLNKYGAIIYFSKCECLLFPSKENRDWNQFNVLELNHRVICSDDSKSWFVFDYKRAEKKWKYIVPVEDFDFEAPELSININKSIC